jgi:hypothetical protein
VAALSGASAQAATGIACISASNPLDASVSYFPPTMRIADDKGAAGAAEVSIAGGFSVHYYNHFKVAKTVCGKHQPSGCSPKTYVLTLCGAAKPTKYDNGTALPTDSVHFSVPLPAIGLAKGSPVPFLEMLGLLEKVEVVDPKYIHSVCLQNLEEEGKITAVSSSPKANWTALIKNHPLVTAVFTDSFKTGESNTAKDIVFDGSADSSGVLGRAEWIKFMSLFFNEEDKANLYFAREQKAYKATEDKIAAIPKNNSTAIANRTCAWVQKNSYFCPLPAGQYCSFSQYVPVYEISFTTYKVDLCKSAGLVPYVNATLVAAGTYKQVFNGNLTAEFHALLHTTDVVIDETYFYGPSTSATKAAVLKSLNITALNKTGAILLRTDGAVSDSVSTVSGGGESLDWLESAIARPALVLEDFAAKVWGNHTKAPPAGCAQYFRDVMSGDMPVVHGKASCAVNEAAEKEGKCITNAISNTYVRPSSPPPPSPSPPPPSPSPPPPATVTVVGAVTLDGYTKATFGATQQTAFKAGIAKLAKVSAAAVTVTVDDAARRRLLAGVTVKYAIATTDTTAAAAIAKTIEETPAATVVTEMKAAGLTEVTTATVTVSKTYGKPGEAIVVDAAIATSGASASTAVVARLLVILSTLVAMAMM